MKKEIKFNEVSYELVENYKEGFDIKEVTSKATEYFNSFDYIVGDWSYGKLRLKGFCDKTNKEFKSINDINQAKKYLKELCAFDCRYFILKKNK